MNTSQAPRPSREKNYDTVVADDLRPAGNGKDCFYCGMPLGEQHETDCVIRKNASWYHVAIKNNKTGEVRLYRHDLEWDDLSEFQWLENNYSCDCNRFLFFGRAGGEDPELDDAHCGTGAYDVLYAKLPTGKIIELEGSADPCSCSVNCMEAEGMTVVGYCTVDVQMKAKP